MKKSYITLKFAQTLDGKIAAIDGSSRWISGPKSLEFSHKLRRDSDGILVGIGTVLRDNPSLTTRFIKGRNPVRIVVDSKLRLPATANVVKSIKEAMTIVFTTNGAPKGKIEKLRKKGVEVIVRPIARDGYIDIGDIIRILYKKGIKKILVEGGKSIITSFLKADLADRIIVIVAPKILGKGVESAGDMGITRIDGALRMRLGSVERLGEDVIYTAYPKK
ncbi:MAG: RibD family protein [Candidatus Omnitrophica bacterium]|nr:RibD family protein [Candidatus Omnitrophota bacterium]